jgi:hypothetical protein
MIPRNEPITTAEIMAADRPETGKDKRNRLETINFRMRLKGSGISATNIENSPRAT